MGAVWGAVQGGGHPVFCREGAVGTLRLGDPRKSEAEVQPARCGVAAMGEGRYGGVRGAGWRLSQGHITHPLLRSWGQVGGLVPGSVSLKPAEK